MNGSAAAWAFAHQIQPVSTKFVLITLACFASKKWLASLSVPDLTKNTGLDRSSIFRALAQLKKLGLIQPVVLKDKIMIYSVDPSHHATLPVSLCDSKGLTMRRVKRSLPSSSPPPEPRSSTLSLFPNPPLPPTGGIPPAGGNGSLDLVEPKKAHKPKRRQYSQDFETFWAAYPDTNASKYTTYEVWNRLKPPLEQCLEAIGVFKKSSDWKRGFVEHPTRWLRGRQWELEES